MATALSPSLLALGTKLLGDAALYIGANFAIPLQDGLSGPRKMQQAVHLAIIHAGFGVKSRRQNGVLYCVITPPRKDHRITALSRQHRSPKPTALPALPYALLPDLTDLAAPIRIQIDTGRYSAAETIATLRLRACHPRPKFRYYPSCKQIVISPARTTPVRAYPSYTNDAMQWSTFEVGTTRVIENSPTTNIVKVRRTVLTLATNRGMAVSTRILGNRLFITRTT